MPPPGDDVRRAAQDAPEHWLTAVDPAWTDDAPPPTWALMGQWRSDAGGTVVEWVDNPAHRPGPAALGWPAPTDNIDFLVQRMATGYAGAETLLDALHDADLITVLGPDGAPAALAAPDGTPVVAVYSGAGQVNGALRTRAMRVTEIVRTAPAGHQLYLNPGSATPIVLDVTQLLDAAGAGR